MLKKLRKKKKRTDLSKLIVKLMNMAHPELKNQNEIDQKLWDDLHIMSNFELKVNSPYPIPEVDKLKGIENIDKVVGISRGGLIPGVMLSHRLNAGFEPLE